MPTLFLQRLGQFYSWCSLARPPRLKESRDADQPRRVEIKEPKTIKLARDAIAGIREMEGQLAAEEMRAGFIPAPKMPLIDRMGRLGYNNETRDRITELLF
jgi:hypothetical protein